MTHAFHNFRAGSVSLFFSKMNLKGKKKNRQFSEIIWSRFFRLTLHLRCLTGFWMRIWKSSISTRTTDHEIWDNLQKLYCGSWMLFPIFLVYLRTQRNVQRNSLSCSWENNSFLSILEAKEAADSMQKKLL